MRLTAMLLLAGALPSAAPGAPRATDVFLDASQDRWTSLARRVWDTPELAFAEKRSSAELAAVLETEGFQVTWGSGGQPTAFVATAGSGGPAIAFLAEYDALPGLSQAAGRASREPLSPGGPGHGCGHNLLGAASVAAAAAANRERVARKLPGTIQLFGTPAEEVGLGKVFMVRDGAFADTAAALAWHPSDRNQVQSRVRLAVTSVEVEFFGRTAHASSSPWLGRSALDALVLFDHAMSLMREHVRPSARIHRVIQEGGAAANVIPDHTRAEYWLREATGEAVAEMLERLRKAADGAALATGTRAQVRLLTSLREPLPNEALDRILQGELERVGPPPFDAADGDLAKSIQKELGFEEAGLATQVLPYAPGPPGGASSDIGEVSAVVPLGELAVATRPAGTAAHHWAQTACAAHPVGYKGMLVAAKVLAAAGVDLLADPAALKAVRAEFAARTRGRPYASPLPPDAAPRAISDAPPRL
jgi:aminobenzoyl-glutamate utilization protein B